MARRKKPENETPEQATIRRQLEGVSNFASRSEKVSWERKMNNFVSLITTLRPIEDQIIALINEKQPILDEILGLRKTMVEQCIHPFDHLVHKEDHIQCKFCDKLLGLPANIDTDEDGEDNEQ